MTNSVVEDKYKKVKVGDIIIRKHTVVGCNSVILPGIELAYATSVGANSLVNKSTKPFDVIGGTPAKYIKTRQNVYLHL
jgi:acetyltransferase-like isoleucine patch superfamily enzyme